MTRKKPGRDKAPHAPRGAKGKPAGGMARQNDRARNAKTKGATVSKTQTTADFPTLDQVAAFIADSPTPVTKRDIARAFHIKGEDRTRLRQLLREMGEGGGFAKTPGKAYHSAGDLPERTLIVITGIDDDGELMAAPLEWPHPIAPPTIYVVASRKQSGELHDGAHVLARLKKIAPRVYEARPIGGAEGLTGVAAEVRVVGVYKQVRDGGYVYPTNKKIKEDFFVPDALAGDVQDGDVVVVSPLPPGSPYPRHRNPARIVERVGAKDDPRLISLIAIHSHGIPTEFPQAVIDESEGLGEPTLAEGREDLRHVPFVTIDGADARDFDDAVYAVRDDNPKNEGGWKIGVAIADVSYYVTPNSALDREAYKRGNSTYFADRVVPMLPERLSNDLCSLRPLVNRAALVAHMVIDKNARLIDYRFSRGLIKSAARLTYEQVEDAHLGQSDDITRPLMDSVIKPLYAAYSVMKHARDLRGALALDLPERKAIIDRETGHITAIVPRQRLASHQLIEEFMILANVAAAHALEDKDAPCVYRVHAEPAFDRLDSTRDFLKQFGYSLPQGDHVHPRDINRILEKTADTPDKDLVHTVLLRTQSQAVYSPENIGHFGLALERYAHFTSPIRRYADLLVHRSLTRAYKLGSGGLSNDEADRLTEIAEHISQTERRSMLAERDVMDRFTAQYLGRNIGQTFMGKISSVTSFGVFITLDESGADGIVPMRMLPRDFYIYDEKKHTLTGRESGRTYRLMDRVIVRLLEADPMRASTVFEMVTGSDESSHQTREGQRHQRGQRRDERGRHKSGKSGGKKPDGKPRFDRDRKDGGKKGGFKKGKKGGKRR